MNALGLWHSHCKILSLEKTFSHVNWHDFKKKYLRVHYFINVVEHLVVIFLKFFEFFGVFLS